MRRGKDEAGRAADLEELMQQLAELPQEPAWMAYRRLSDRFFGGEPEPDLPHAHEDFVRRWNELKKLFVEHPSGQLIDTSPAPPAPPAPWPAEHEGCAPWCRLRREH